MQHERRRATVDEVTEWLEADGLGGFASGTSAGIRTRRYHGLLLVAAAPPADRRVLVQGFVARLETPVGGAEYLSHLSRALAWATSAKSPMRDPPYSPRGCPFQAWSVAELLRLERDVLAIEAAPLAAEY